MRSSVDLPEPLGPSRAVSLPSGASNEMSSRAVKSPKLLGDRLDGDHDLASPVSDEAHGEQGGQGDQREQRRGSVRAREIEVLEALLDEQRQRLGLARDLARDDADRAELADRPRGREHDAVGEAPADGGQRDAPERLPRPGAERGRRLLLLVADLLQHRRDLARHERQRDEEGGEHDAGQGEDDLDAVVGEPRPEPARRGRRRSSSDRPTTTGEIANGRSISASSSRLPGARPRTSAMRREHAEHGVERDGDGGDLEREEQRVDGRRRRDRVENAPSPCSNVR